MTSDIRYNRLFVLALLGGALLWGPAIHAAVPQPKPSFGFLAMLERQVGLNPEQTDAVRGILAQQRDAMQRVRQDTDVKIRALLNGDQQKKFDEMMARNRAFWEQAQK